MIDGDETATTEWNKCINDGIGEATNKFCASIDESSDSSSRVTGNYVSAQKGVGRLSKRKKIRVLKNEILVSIII